MGRTKSHSQTPQNKPEALLGTSGWKTPVLDLAFLPGDVCFSGVP